MIAGDGTWIFVHIQKTGGNAIRTALGAPTNYPHKHRRAVELREIYGEQAWQSAFKFSFVRNPWDRLVSWWSMIDQQRGKGGSRFMKYVADRAPTFEAFLLNCGEEFHDDDGSKWIWRNQIDYLTDENGDLLVDFVGRFEKLEEDFARTAEAVGRPCTKLPRLNSSVHRDYASYYSEASAAMVAARFNRDISAFGYRFHA